MMRKLCTMAILVVAFGCAAHSVQAQFAGTGAPDGFRDTSMLKPAAGSNVSVIVFEDLGCPACAHAHPIEAQAAGKYHVPLVRYDFPFPQHIWTFDGAVCARYLQERVSPALAEQYRNAVFAAQGSIASKDDLQSFTQRWMQQHGQQMPFVLDPSGELAKKVRAEYELGLRLNVQFTPTVVVVTRNRYQVVCGTKTGSSDPMQLYPVIEAALAQTKAAPALPRPSSRR